MLRKHKIIALVGFILVLIITIAKKPVLISIYRTNPELVTTRFWKAIKENDIYLAKSLSVDTKHPSLDSWFKGHEEFDCDFFEEQFGPTRVGAYLNSDMWEESIGFVCSRNKGDKYELYCLHIEDILVTKNDGQWLISDWSNISEGHEIDDC